MQTEIDVIKQKIAEMVEIDQRIRFDPESIPADIAEIDTANTAQMKEWVAEYGWFKTSVFGEETSHQAWLLVQHADLDPDFQQKCLDLMLAMPDGEIQKRDVAYLTDRLMVAKDGTQKYGTQLVDHDTYAILRPVVDLEHLDENRKEMGLEPIAEYLETYKEAYGTSAFLTEADYLNFQKTEPR